MAQCILIGISPNMKKKSGYITNVFTYDINTNTGLYKVAVKVKFYIQSPNYNSWDSPDDYYGYTEIIDTDIVKILCESENENQDVIEVEYSQLSDVLQKEIIAALDVLIPEEQPSDEVYD